MSKRIRNWQSALAALIRERRNQPFEWGKNDCAIFPSDCVLAITGEDPARGIRGTYSSAGGAAEVISRFGGLSEIASARLGMGIPVSLAQAGDVVLTLLADRETLAVCVGSGLVAPGEHGLVSIPLSHAICAWRCTRAD